MFKVKVAHLITGLNAGGAEMMVYKIVKNTDKGKFIPIVISLLPPGPVSELIEKENIKLYHLNLSKIFSIPRVFFELVRIIKKEKPIILHNYLFHADLFGRITGWVAKVPIIVSSIRNEDIGGAKREKLMRLTDFCVDQVTAVCQAAGEAQVKAKSIKREKLKIIYNGVELNKYKTLTEKNIVYYRNKLNIPRNHKILITVGRLEPQKNHQVLLKAFASVIQRYQDTTLLIVGDGSLKVRLKKLVSDLGLEKHVIFTGVRNDVSNLLAISDAFILVSNWEGMPNVILEALASGLPVVATAVGGTPEVLVDGQTGFLVEPNNEDMLKNKLYKVLSLPEKKVREMSVNGRRVIEENFTIEKTIESTEQMYNELLRKKNIN